MSAKDGRPAHDGGAACPVDMTSATMSADRRGAFDGTNHDGPSDATLSVTLSTIVVDCQPAASSKRYTIDQVLEQFVGDFGRAQFWQFVLISSGWILKAFHTFVIIFSDRDPTWTCVDDVNRWSTMTATSGSSTAASAGGGSGSRGVCNASSASSICELPPGTWQWTNQKRSTISQFGMVCSREFEIGLSQSVFFLGYLTGAGCFGSLSDGRLGRKRSLMLGATVAGGFGMLTASSPSVAFYILFRYLTGVGTAGISLNAFSLSTETIGPRKRGRVGTSARYFYAMGMMVLPLFALLASDSWRMVMIITGIPSLLFTILCGLLAYESPRWLLVHNREEEALRMLKKLAKKNRSWIPDYVTLKSATAVSKETAAVNATPDSALQAVTVRVTCDSSTSSSCSDEPVSRTDASLPPPAVPFSCRSSMQAATSSLETEAAATYPGPENLDVDSHGKGSLPVATASACSSEASEDVTTTHIAGNGRDHWQENQLRKGTLPAPNEGNEYSDVEGRRQFLEMEMDRDLQEGEESEEENKKWEHEEGRCCSESSTENASVPLPPRIDVPHDVCHESVHVSGKLSSAEHSSDMALPSSLGNAENDAGANDGGLPSSSSPAVAGIRKPGVKSLAETDSGRASEAAAGVSSRTKKLNASASKEKVGLRDVFKCKETAKRMVCIVYIWFASSIAYYISSLNLGNLGSNIYISTFFNGLVEVPAFALGTFLISFWGRRMLLFDGLAVAGASAVIVGLMPLALGHDVVRGSGADSTVRLVVALFGKFGIAFSYNVLYLVNSELFPTVVRNVANGTGFQAAQLGAAIAPFITVLGRTNQVIPSMIMALTSFSGAFVSLLLPETFNEPLYETIEEMPKSASALRTLRNTFVCCKECKAAGCKRGSCKGNDNLECSNRCSRTAE
ncbi:hypothetical protein CBR_g36861 [Chara braunii]|uniref:Major facilitator superfamily (MFS) profile domain-containing protein n=1 Tax=Chara braunii TaxID=69332 RepID=A0A388LLN1_CHABU|nr:hypothetical protein CBR_g36861 [Chara braunii]|eukprot:GBG83246.1 hypothetical protein CBR_g36861 [Chara braunii]